MDEAVRRPQGGSLRLDPDAVSADPALPAFLARPADVGPPRWTRIVTYFRRGRRVLQHEHVVAVVVSGLAPRPGVLRRPTVSACGRSDTHLTR